MEPGWIFVQGVEMAIELAMGAEEGHCRAGQTEEVEKSERRSKPCRASPENDALANEEFVCALKKTMDLYL
jgi:hypothetical protein